MNGKLEVLKLVIEGLLSFAILGVASYLAVTGRETPPWVAPAIAAMLGFWFGVSAIGKLRSMNGRWRESANVLQQRDDGTWGSPNGA